MTKLRAPHTLDAGLARIAGHLPGGWSEMATIAGRSERTVRNWGDPETRDQIPMDCAVGLDIAYMAAGGAGAPLHETYTHKLEMAGISRFAAGIELGRLTADAIREAGEANAALVIASLPGAELADKAKARLELEEALEVLRRALAQLVRQLDVHPATGPPD